MHFLITALICALFASCASTQKQAFTTVEIEEIKLRYIEKKQFKRIHEYLTGKENTGNRMILRSTPDEKDGHYFTLILDEKVGKLPKGTVIVGDFFTPSSVEKQTQEFTLPNKRPKTNEISFGLTGAKWLDKGGTPSAWRFTIIDPNGNVLTEKQSYLWKL